MRLGACCYEYYIPCKWWLWSIQLAAKNMPMPNLRRALSLPFDLLQYLCFALIVTYKLNQSIGIVISMLTKVTDVNFFVNLLLPGNRFQPLKFHIENINFSLGFSLILFVVFKRLLRFLICSIMSTINHQTVIRTLDLISCRNMTCITCIRLFFRCHCVVFGTNAKQMTYKSGKSTKIHGINS